MNEEQQRINKIKTFRKMHIDSSVKTAHFFKKSIMVPHDRHRSEAAKHNRQQTNPRHPFSRGIMTFDDYNYDQYNSHVLISEPVKEKKKTVMDKWQEVMERGRPEHNEQNQVWTEENLKLRQQTDADYEHDALTLQSHFSKTFDHRLATVKLDPFEQVSSLSDDTDKTGCHEPVQEQQQALEEPEADSADSEFVY